VMCAYPKVNKRRTVREVSLECANKMAGNSTGGLCVCVWNYKVVGQ
jgi:hypothetical protein